MYRLVLLGLLVLTGSVCVAEPIKIGVIAPLSGPVASWGLDTQRALELANEKFGAGRFSFVFEDGKCLGKEAATAAQKLVSIDKVKFGMVVCTEEMLASAPIFDRAKVVVVAPGATAASISGISSYVFRTWPSDAFGADRLVQYMKGKNKKVGVFSEGRGLPQEFAKAFTDMANKGALPIVTETFFSDEREFKSALLRLSQQSIDGLLVNSDSEAAFVNVLKQLHELKLPLQIYGNYVGSSQAFRSLAGALAEGLVYFDVPVLNWKGQDSDLLSEFEKKFGPPSSAPYMVASSISAFRSISEVANQWPDSREALRAREFESAIGKFHFDNNGDVVGIFPSLKKIENGTTMEISR